MTLPSTGEPFGLPRGTVRGIIALTCLALTVYDFVIDQQFTVELLAFSGPYLGFYFATRQTENDDDPLPPPSFTEGPLGEPVIADPE